MRERKNRMYILGLLAFVLLLTGAYALFATTLNITGRAGGETEFKIEFSEHNVSNEEKAQVSLDSLNTTMDITADLSYPGDTVTIFFTIKNTGRLSATVDDLIINENSSTDFSISITGLDAIEGTTLAPDAETSGSIIVTWNVGSTNEAPDDVNFSVTVDYVQST
ncbi:MAG: hypothetical protein PHG03_02765 [Bacilli bacterium]|nr:hypothetical protein [Bacilli bacterium]MDD4795463.1 hypothetical protein [Bacilli bacterium]